jgi:hypothetical protein
MMTLILKIWVSIILKKNKSNISQNLEGCLQADLTILFLYLDINEEKE